MVPWPSGLALDFNVALMQINNLFDNGQPQARAGHIILEHTTSTVEPFKDMRQVFGKNAAAAIFNTSSPPDRLANSVLTRT